jgi:hypothetical protein
MRNSISRRVLLRWCYCVEEPRKDRFTTIATSVCGGISATEAAIKANGDNKEQDEFASLALNDEYSRSRSEHESRSMRIMTDDD